MGFFDTDDGPDDPFTETKDTARTPNACQRDGCGHAQHSHRLSHAKTAVAFDGPCYECRCDGYLGSIMEGASPEAAFEDIAGGIPITIPDGVTPLVGWRGWAVDPEKMLLTGAVHQEPWPPGEVSAAICAMKRPKVVTHLHNIPPEHFHAARAAIDELVEAWAAVWWNPHDVPDPDCTCGLYAKLRRGEVDSGIVKGRIEAWGRIVKGADGFRAEYAKITGLLVNEGAMLGPIRRSNHAELVHRLAEVYGVPVLDDEDRRIPVHEIDPADEGWMNEAYEL